MTRRIRETLAQDVRLAGRMLGRERGFTATAVLVLGLGIGVNTMLFTVLNAHTIRGLPIDRPDRVVHLSSVDERRVDRPISYPDYDDLRSASTLGELGAFANAPVVVGDADGAAPDRYDGAYVTAGAFAAVGVRASLGRPFALGDDQPGAAAVVLLGEGPWKSRYAADPQIVGRTILVNGFPATVIGVVPRRSGFPSGADVWLPLSAMPGLAREARDARTLRVVARLTDGASLAAARAELGSIAERLARQHPDTNARIGVAVVPVNERFLGRLTDPAWLAFMTAGFLIVVISCANVANLMLDRAVRRAREVAIRASLGATRRRVVLQFLVEAALIAALGGALGLLVARLGVQLFRAAIPDNVLPYWFDYSFDARVLAALAAVSAGTVFVFGLVPALSAAKTDVAGLLREAAQTGRGAAAARRWATAFLVAEFALTVVLLANLSLNMRAGSLARSADAVVETRQVLTASITLPAAAYRTEQQRGAFYDRLSGAVAAIPGVVAVSVASALPLSGAQERRLDVPGFDVPAGAAPPSAWTVAVGPRYFETLGVRLLRGREFSGDASSADRTGAIVNQRFVERYFGERDPIGQRIALRPATNPAAPAEAFVVIGVAPLIRQRPVPDPEPVVYLPFAAALSSNASLLVRGRGDAAMLAPAVRAGTAAIDRNLPLYRVRTMSRAIGEAQWNARVAAGLLDTLTALSLLLSTVGLGAVTSHGVTARTREIGVRMALGARTGHVVGLVLKRAVVQLGLGFGAGILCTIGWGAVFSSGQPKLLVSDPWSLATIVSVLLTAGVLASAVPACRAARLDPTVAIRRG